MDTKNNQRFLSQFRKNIYSGEIISHTSGDAKNKPHRHSHRRKRKTDTHAQRSRIRIRHQWALYRSRYYGRYRQRASTSARIWITARGRCGATTISPRNTAEPVVTTRLSTLYGSKILPFLQKPNRDMPSRKCIMPDRGIVTAEMEYMSP